MKRAPWPWRTAGVRSAALAAALACSLAGCAATPPPPGTQVGASRVAAAAIPGQSTRASLLAALGPTRHIVFDSGYETWLYQVPAGAGLFSEFVVLIGPDGVVRKTRMRAPEPAGKK